MAPGPWHRSRPLKQKFSTADISPVLEAIARTAPKLVLIGGQAINYWSDKFQENTLEVERRLRPYTSEDLDFYGSACSPCSRTWPREKKHP